MERRMINQRELEELIKFSEKDERFGVAWRGALSQIRLRLHLESLGFTVVESQSDNAGAPDFIINGKTLEHKRARKDVYSNGSLKAEFQKSRGRIPNRLYDDNFSDFVSADVSHHTGLEDDYRYARTSDLCRHKEHSNKIASMQKINEGIWASDLGALMKESEE